MGILPTISAYALSACAVAGVVAQTINVVETNKQEQEPPVIEIEAEPEQAPVPVTEPAPEPVKEETAPATTPTPTTTTETYTNHHHDTTVPAGTDTSDPYWYLNEDTKAYLKWQKRTGVYSNEDYIRYYTGVCPSAQDAPADSVYSMGHLATIGVSTRYPALEHFIEHYWAGYKRANDSTEGRSSSLAQMGYDGYPYADQAALRIDWHTLTVSLMSPSWSMSDEMFWDRDYVPDYWEEARSRAESYLRELDARYNALCPND